MAAYRTPWVAALLSVGLLLATAVSGESHRRPNSRAYHSRQASLLLSAPRLVYRAALDHLAARRRSLSTTETPAGEGRSVPVEVKPISFGQGLWIFGGSVAFSVVKVLGLSLLYYVAPEFVETWGPTFG